MSEERGCERGRLQAAVRFQEEFAFGRPGLGRRIRDNPDPQERDPLTPCRLGKIGALHVHSQDLPVGCSSRTLPRGDDLVHREDGADVEGETNGLESVGRGLQKEGVGGKRLEISEHLGRDDDLPQAKAGPNPSTEPCRQDREGSSSQARARSTPRWPIPP